MAYVEREAMYLQCDMYCALRPTTAVPTALYGPVNFTKLETAPIEQESDDLISNRAGTVGEVAYSVQKPTKPGQISMECNTMPSVLRAVIFNADIAAFSQSANATTEYTIDTAEGVWTKLPGEFLSATGLALKKADGITAVTADKYAIDRVLGALLPLHADAVGTGMKLTFAKTAVAGEVYSAGKAKSSYLYLTGKAYDKNTDTWGILTIERAIVANKAAYDWVAGGWMKGALTGPMQTPLGASSPIKFIPTDFTL